MVGGAGCTSVVGTEFDGIETEGAVCGVSGDAGLSIVVGGDGSTSVVGTEFDGAVFDGAEPGTVDVSTVDVSTVVDGASVVSGVVSTVVLVLLDDESSETVLCTST